jgi:O-antigen biosynthesis protein WbqV
MPTRLRLTPRQWLIVLHDVIVTGVAIAAVLLIRFEGTELSNRLGWLPVWAPVFMALAALVYFYFRLHEAKWRFTSLPELKTIVRASSVLALTLLVLDYILLSPLYFGTFYFGKVTIALYWLLQMAFLTGSRVVYRYFRDVRTQLHVRADAMSPTLILGMASDADISLRGIESGSIRKVMPVGILSPARSDRGVTIRAVPVLGSFDEFAQVIAQLSQRDVSIARLLLMPSAFEAGTGVEAVLMQARRLGISASRLRSLEESDQVFRLSPVAIEDLLLRPSVKIDYHGLENFVKGKSIIVSGGGGSIGAEICDRIVTFGAARLLLIENSEPALYAVLEALSAKGSSARIEGRLADVRDRDRVFSLFDEFKPDIVFHAAALKHVPLLEQDWMEGVKTNVFGSVNIADAARQSGAAAMVMISTDKAIEPVSVLGATKRLAEMYCQALDADRGMPANGGRAPMRLISVRFGNVLASNGSVVPKFKAQIEAGGPVTVTHPDMVRYFMTIREACDLVLSAAGHALGPERSDASIYVLNMGQPVRILELAERLIRLSGLEPGRDVEIKFTGIRPGERLNEQLFARDEANIDVGIPGVVAAKPLHPPLSDLLDWLERLATGLSRHDGAAVGRVLREAVPDYSRVSQ